MLSRCPPDHPRRNAHPQRLRRSAGGGVRCSYPRKPGSLYDILHDHAGLQLFVRPLCWTDLHAKFTRLLASYGSLPMRQPTPSPSSPPWSPSQHGRRLLSPIIGVLNLLMSSAQPELSKTRAMSTLLSEFLSPKHSSTLRTRWTWIFDLVPRRYPHAVRCHLLFNHIYPNTSTTTFDSSYYLDHKPGG